MFNVHLECIVSDWHHKTARDLAKEPIKISFESLNTNYFQKSNAKFKYP